MSAFPTYLNPGISLAKATEFITFLITANMMDVEDLECGYDVEV